MATYNIIIKVFEHHIFLFMYYSPCLVNHRHKQSSIFFLIFASGFGFRLSTTCSKLNIHFGLQSFLWLKIYLFFLLSSFFLLEKLGVFSFLSGFITHLLIALDNLYDSSIFLNVISRDLADIISITDCKGTATDKFAGNCFNLFHSLHSLWIKKVYHLLPV